MINKEKRQVVEMGHLLKQDGSGKYRQALRSRVIELRQETQLRLKETEDKDEIFRLESLLRALLVADRILDKALVESHDMSNASRPVS
ncbi:MAG: hypothetical protein K2W99_04015 [Chthoniobacterales bacterium]|nr:hypothetical protein [Chthoniobacterales bacterium]